LNYIQPQPTMIIYKTVGGKKGSGVMKGKSTRYRGLNDRGHGGSCSAGDNTAPKNGQNAGKAPVLERIGGSRGAQQNQTDSIRNNKSLMIISNKNEGRRNIRGARSAWRLGKLPLYQNFLFAVRGGSKLEGRFQGGT